jgi:regulator of protease activity HflC (stomatin/prohibitin superfamily)
MVLWEILAALAGFAALGAAASVRVVQQYERGLVFRFGRVLERVRAPGLTMIVPVADRLRKVNVQIVTMPVPAQDGITRDNVTVKVDAVVYFRVVDPIRALVSVQNYPYAVSQVAQTSLRSVIGKSDLDDLLTNRERLNQGLELMIDNPAVEWGIHIDRVEIKDVALPETMKRSMSRQAEAERERRARVISADGELQASDKLAQAAGAMAETPGALQLRLLETIVEVAAEKNSTLVLPFPVELLRFLERNSPQVPGSAPRAESAPEKAGLEGPTPVDVAALEQAGSEPALFGEAAALAQAGSETAILRRATTERSGLGSASDEALAEMPSVAVAADDQSRDGETRDEHSGPTT